MATSDVSGSLVLGLGLSVLLGFGLSTGSESGSGLGSGSDQANGQKSSHGDSRHTKYASLVSCDVTGKVVREYRLGPSSDSSNG